MRVLGVDYGERRIGLAVSDPSGTLARPLRTLRPGGSLPARATAVAAEARVLAADADGLAAVVVGLPRSLDGAPHEQTARVLAFVDRLREAIDVPVALQDERLSSVEADARLAARERSWRKRSARLDAAAAAVILQDHLDQQPPPAGRLAEGRVLDSSPAGPGGAADHPLPAHDERPPAPGGDGAAGADHPLPAAPRGRAAPTSGGRR